MGITLRASDCACAHYYWEMGQPKYTVCLSKGKYITPDVIKHVSIWFHHILVLHILLEVWSMIETVYSVILFHAGWK